MIEGELDTALSRPRYARHAKSSSDELEVAVGLNIALGIIGALVGGFLFDLIGAGGVTGFNIYSMIVAIVGSVVVLLIYNAVAGPPPRLMHRGNIAIGSQ